MTVMCHAIEDNTHISKLLLAVEHLDIGQLTTIQEALTDNIYSKVHQAVYDYCICHSHGWYAINEDIVVAVA